jgi:AmmeMemoRadiSam system protein B
LIEECLAGASTPPADQRPVGGIVPHAGWAFSGPTAAKVFYSFSGPVRPRTFVLFGAVHVWGVRRPALYSGDPWWSPLGPVEVDRDLARELAEAAGDQMIRDDEAHDGEHSLEVQVPFVRYLFPDACIVPILVPPGPDAVALGTRIGQFLASREDVMTVGSTDLTHYGPRYGFAPQGTGPAALAWVRGTNDRAMLDLMRGMQAEEVIPEASRHQNACGAGAIAAAVAAARARKAADVLVVDYTTSADVRPEWGCENFVGYAGVLFSCRC